MCVCACRTSARLMKASHLVHRLTNLFDYHIFFGIFRQDNLDNCIMRLHCSRDFLTWTSMPIISQSTAHFGTSLPIICQSKAYYWTSMPIISQSAVYYWTSLPIINKSTAYYSTSRSIFSCRSQCMDLKTESV